MEMLKKEGEIGKNENRIAPPFGPRASRGGQRNRPFITVFRPPPFTSKSFVIPREARELSDLRAGKSETGESFILKNPTY